MQLRPKQISVFYTFIYWVCEGHKKRGRGAGSMCPSLAYKFNSDKNRFLPRFRLNSILGYVSERDIRFVLFFSFAVRSSVLDGIVSVGEGGRWNGRHFQWPPHQESPYLCVRVWAWVRRGCSMRTGVGGRETEPDCHSGCYFTCAHCGCYVSFRFDFGRAILAPNGIWIHLEKQ